MILFYMVMMEEDVEMGQGGESKMSSDQLHAAVLVVYAAVLVVATQNEEVEVEERHVQHVQLTDDNFH